MRVSLGAVGAGRAIGAGPPVGPSGPGREPPAERRRGWSGGRLRRNIAAVLSLVVAAQSIGVALAATVLKFRADDWITECDGSPARSGSCSITVPFWQVSNAGKGSFALVIMLRSGEVGIVGQPYPVRAVLRVDKNLPIECRQARYCIFPQDAGRTFTAELEHGSLVYVDVFTARSEFHFSLTPKGYQAGIAQIEAWGFPLAID